MFNITLKNNKTFVCDSTTTIFEAAKANGIALEHSCLTARCRSCLVKILEGTTKDKLDDLVLSMDEKEKNYTLSCNAIPTSDVSMDVEDLGDVVLYDKKIVPSKIASIEYLTKSVIKLILRLPPNANFKYNSGQYVNLIWSGVKRSYSIANSYQENTNLEFFIKKYEGGLMSDYWFHKAKINDLLRVEGPLGSFFLRDTEKQNIIFLATGTGIAPVKAILEHMETSEKDFSNKKVYVFFGARYEDDLFWTLNSLKNADITYIPVLSRSTKNWVGKTGYVQNVVIEEEIDLSNTQVYACGSNEMIESAKIVLSAKALPENDFFSDAFICTN
jgi:CDP-4-dehydro-6-deoxyglucose reductase